MTIRSDVPEKPGDSSYSDNAANPLKDLAAFNAYMRYHHGLEFDDADEAYEVYRDLSPINFSAAGDMVVYEWGVDSELYLRYLCLDEEGEIEERLITRPIPENEEFTSYNLYREEHGGSDDGWEFGSSQDWDELYKIAVAFAEDEGLILDSFNPSKDEAKARVLGSWEQQ